MFDAHGLSGTVKFDQFLEVIEKKSRDSPTPGPHPPCGEGRASMSIIMSRLVH